MNIPTKFKIYGGVVAIGLAALITDQLTREPEPLSAQAIAAQLLVSNVAHPVHGSSTTVPPGDAHSITDLLRVAGRSRDWAAGASPDARDPFLPTLAWGASAVASSGAPGGTPASRFVQAHRLTNVISAAEGRHAMVDGRILAVGQSLGGFTLTTITPRSAVFESAGMRAVLTMEDVGTRSASIAGP